MWPYFSLGRHCIKSLFVSRRLSARQLCVFLFSVRIFHIPRAYLAGFALYLLPPQGSPLFLTSTRRARDFDAPRDRLLSHVSQSGSRPISPFYMLFVSRCYPSKHLYSVCSRDAVLGSTFAQLNSLVI